MKAPKHIGFAPQPAPRRFKKKVGFERGKPKVSARAKTNCSDHLDGCVGSTQSLESHWRDGEVIF